MVEGLGFRLGFASGASFSKSKVLSPGLDTFWSQGLVLWFKV